MKLARRQVAKALPPRNPHAAGVISPFGAVLGDSIRGVHQSKTSFKVTNHDLRKRASAGGRKPQTLLRSGLASCLGPAPINSREKRLRLSLEVTWQPVGTIGWLSRDALACRGNWMGHIAA
jgi:hypothetical protein